MHYPFSTLCDENGRRGKKMDVVAVLEPTLVQNASTHVRNLKLNFYFLMRVGGSIS